MAMPPHSPLACRPANMDIRSPTTAVPLIAFLFLLGCGDSGAVAPRQEMASCGEPVALIDLVGGTYCGFLGGLYDGSNEMPTAHEREGLALARQVQPLNRTGSPDPQGRIVLLSVGMSNATQEWCHARSTGSSADRLCNSWTLMGQAAMDPAVNHRTLSIANGALGGQALQEWDDPSDRNYDRVRDQVLAPDGLSEGQVQVIWVKSALADAPSRPSLPTRDADAYLLEATIGGVLRTVRLRYPNVKLVFFTSRIFSYAPPGTTNSPEPYAYESGFGTKWAIEAQIEQRAGGSIDAETGDLSSPVAPWAAWGPYLWAPGDHPRSDGLQWRREYIQSDGVHPSRSGEEVVANYLLDFFKTSPFTRGWFLANP